MIIYACIIPTFLEIAVPLSALLGVTLAFARLSGDSEIVVIRASGINILQLLKPVFIFGILAAILTAIVAFYLRPWSNNQLETRLFKIASSKSIAGVKAGVFSDLANLTIYAEEVDYDTGELQQVLIDDRRDQESRQIVASESGILSSDPEQRAIIFDLARGKIHRTSQDNSYTITTFLANKISIDPDESSREKKKIKEMLVPELQIDMTRHQSALDNIKNGTVPEEIPEEESALYEKEESELINTIRKINIEIARKYTFPFAALILTIIAMPLGIQPARSQKTWGSTLSAVISLSVIIFYYILLSISVTVSKNGALSPYISLWIPNIVLAFIAYVLIHQMKSEKWQTILHFFEHILKKFNRAIPGNKTK